MKKLLHILLVTSLLPYVAGAQLVDQENNTVTQVAHTQAYISSPMPAEDNTTLINDDVNQVQPPQPDRACIEFRVYDNRTIRLDFNQAAQFEIDTNTFFMPKQVKANDLITFEIEKFEAKKIPYLKFLDTTWQATQLSETYDLQYIKYMSEPTSDLASKDLFLRKNDHRINPNANKQIVYLPNTTQDVSFNDLLQDINTKRLKKGFFQPGALYVVYVLASAKTLHAASKS
ncbi:MAG: hypothetical protein AAF380_01700 [Bacteroidota bacterium]